MLLNKNAQDNSYSAMISNRTELTKTPFKKHNLSQPNLPVVLPQIQKNTYVDSSNKKKSVADFKVKEKQTLSSFRLPESIHSCSLDGVKRSYDKTKEREYFGNTDLSSINLMND